MRRLKQIKLTYREKTGTSYKIIWEESSSGKLWEKHLLESSEYPRAELEEAVDDMGHFLIAACAIRLTDEQMRRNVDVTRVVVDYKSVRQIAISADILLPTGYMALPSMARRCRASHRATSLTDPLTSSRRSVSDTSTATGPSRSSSPKMKKMRRDKHDGKR